MFEQDEKTIRKADKLLKRGVSEQEVTEVLTELTTGYKKLVRQMRRTITMGDRMQEELQRCARTDGLTGISNRRHFMEVANRELARSKRTHKPFSLCLLDADFFKKINDAYGHDAGDKALISLTEIMSQQVRDMDVVARLGGEEFVILFPETACCTAQEIAERVRKAIATTPVSHNETTFTLTVSMGVTSSTGQLQTPTVDDSRKCTTPPTATLDQLLQYADIALYAAKKNGRNCVESYAGSSCSRNECA